MGKEFCDEKNIIGFGDHRDLRFCMCNTKRRACKYTRPDYRNRNGFKHLHPNIHICFNTAANCNTRPSPNEHHCLARERVPRQ